MPSVKKLLKINRNYLEKNQYLNKFSFKKIKRSNPWFTLPCNKFLTLILNKKYRVFEYGSGSSTFFFRENVKKYFHVSIMKIFIKN